MSEYKLSHLQELEAESIHIIREGKQVAVLPHVIGPEVEG